jgi:putative ABC transport system permease protein
MHVGATNLGATRTSATAASPIMWLDLRQALKSLAGRPAFTAIAVATLALGIGSSVAVFTVVNALLLRPLPYADPDRLVAIADITHGRTSGVGLDNFRDWQRENTVFEDMALTENADAVFGGQAGEEPERVHGADVTAAFFRVVGVRPLLGRAFSADDEFKGEKVDVVVLSHVLWQRRYGGRPDIVGRSIAFDGHPCTVLGVMPPGFWYVDATTSQFFVPQRWRGGGRGQHQYTAIARLKRGVTLEAAQARMSAIAARIEREYSLARGWGVLVTPLDHEIRAAVTTPAVVLAIAVAIVLLIACSNLAGLLVVRAASRSRETAIRAALGAGRARLVAGGLAEALILAVFGGALGTWLAYALVRGAAARVPSQYELPMALPMDAQVLVFAVTVSAASAIASSLGPSWRAARLDPVLALRSGSAATGISRGQNRWLRAAIGAQLALAAVLLVTGALVVASLVSMMRADLGFEPAGLLTMQLRHLDGSVTRKNAADFYRSLVQRVGRIPGVASVAASWSPPLSGRYTGNGFTIDGRPLPEEWRQMSALYCPVTPGYFSTMGIRLLSGRDFDAHDTAESPPVVVINRALATRHWRGGDALGARLRQDGTIRTVVGVVADVHHNGPTGDAPPAIYYPHAQQPGTGYFLLVRSGADPRLLVRAIREAAAELDRGTAVIEVRPMGDLLRDRLGASRLIAGLMTGFAVLALALTAVGLYGVVAQWVVQRRQELGVRVALGATRGQLVGLVLRQGLTLSLAGACAGLAGAAAVTRALGAMLFGIGPRDPLVFGGVALVLMAIALAACYAPACRAARVDPIEALRSE